MVQRNRYHGMSDKTYQQFAEEFINLWQKQWASLTQDKHFLQSMLEMMRKVQYPSGQNTHDAKKNAQPASHPAHASDDVDGNLANLAFRLAMCERRLERLEAGAKKSPVARRAKKTQAKRGKRRK